MNISFYLFNVLINNQSSMIPSYLTSPYSYLDAKPRVGKWGRSMNDFIGTDTSVQYIRNLVDVFSKNYIVTDAILPDDFHVSIIIEQYKKGSEQRCDRIYTPINAPSKISKMCHQNWICLDFLQKKLFRFEPNYEMEEFNIDNLCKKIASITNVTYNGPEKNGIDINPFNGCRLMSTILASLHIMDVDVYLQELDLLKFAYIAQQEIISFTPVITTSKRITRSKVA